MRSDIKIVVNRLCRKYETRNPFRIASDMKIIVQYGDLGELDGCYLYKKRQRIILLNDRIEDRNYLCTVMAHELGHAVLHRDNQCYFFGSGTFFLKSKPENEAHTFAAELLIPDEILFENPGLNKEQIARLTGYSEKLLDFKNISRGNQ